MAVAEFEVPKVQPYPLVDIPKIKPDATVHLKSFPASEKIQEGIGFPGPLVDNWHKVAIDKMGDLLNRYRSLAVYMDACVHCGACTDKCHYFLGTADPKNMPVARQELMRKVYRRYFTFAGKYFPKLVGAADLTEDVLNDWYSYFYQCSECRRCSVYCPYGIDTAEVTMAAREIMDAVGMGQKYTNEILGKLHRIGNNLGLPGPALLDTLEGLEEDILEDTGVAVKMPIDVKGAEVLLITPSADFFSEPHVESLIGYAKVFHEAGISWTLSSLASEAGNFGLFIGSYENMRRAAMRIREAALELGVKRIVVGECGHAWRVAYSFWNTLTGVGHGGEDEFTRALQAQLDPRYPAPQHICEMTLDLINQGVLKFDKEKNDHRTITFHDSCNVARGSRMGNMPGGQFVIPREIIKAVANNFHDMADETIGEGTFCCGGGGGILTDDLMEVRVKGAMPRMQALQCVVDEHQVNFMAAICAICKAQFSKVLPYYKFDMSMIGGVHQLVSTSIRLSEKK
ncbi:sulfate reduction electron transfer complex DsrMKJOP subunit DsrK [Sulfurirhabdus autotrophica]|uniref:Fe-S oxidoreductase n=1 Tax=Sulfurirhabdus autotrophica TaxID=1706046 RepID=A0A4R3Y531_9PROT|nr:(Fe-S)-binding protein [Sulfurirhabdus autotrophica]TCV86682.1 Fe-S oxidoreductase [Sulfurirhabdus autotrophica]